MSNSTHNNRWHNHFQAASIKQPITLTLRPNPVDLDKLSNEQRRAITVIFQQLQTCGTRPLLDSPANFKPTLNSIGFFSKDFKTRHLNAPAGRCWNQAGRTVQVQIGSGATLFMHKVLIRKKQVKQADLSVQPHSGPMKLWKYHTEGLAQGNVIALWCELGPRAPDAESVNNDNSQAVVDNGALTRPISFTQGDLDGFSLSQEDVEYGVSQYHALGEQYAPEFPAEIGGPPVADSGALGTINLSFTPEELREFSLSPEEIKHALSQWPKHSSFNHPA